MFGRKNEAKLPPGVYPDEEVSMLAGDFPWLGEEPFPVATDRRPPRPIINDLEYVRRILISWLIGRPVSEMAKRVGCGERSVRNVIEKVVYVDEYDLESGWSYWIKLGLIGAFDVTTASTVTGWQPDPDVVEVTVICQVCHRAVGIISMSNTLLGEQRGLQVESDVLFREILAADRLERRRLARVQGYLILHFYVGRDNIKSNMRKAKHRSHSLSQDLKLIPRNQPFKWVSRRIHYTESVSVDALAVVPEERDPDWALVAPIIDGCPISFYDARRRWKKLIS